MVAVYRRLAEARANLKNSLVHEGEMHLFTPLMESWEIMLVEETQQEQERRPNRNPGVLDL